LVPAVPPVARRPLDRPLARDVERVLRAALTGPDWPGVDVGLDILDSAGAGPDGRTAQRSRLQPRYPGRHERSPAGGRFVASSAARYVRSLLVVDTAVAAAAGSALRPDAEGAVPILLLPAAMVVSLRLGGAYERRVLLAGVAEYGRVVRAGVGLMAAAVPASALAPATLPPSYVLAVLPAATVGAVAGRILVRRWRGPRVGWLTGAVAGGRPMHR
jgi:hypothetical protein